MNRLVRRRWLTVALVAISTLLLPGMATAQQKEQEELDASLLELLDEPPMEEQSRPNVKPEDVGLGGEDLGEQSDNPVEAVKQSMLAAAEYLSRGFTNSQTQTLQKDIVTRLDELIAELEQEQQDASQSQQQSSSSEQEQDSADRQTEAQSGEGQSESQPSEETGSGDGSEEGEAGGQEPDPQSGPGESGPEADPKVRLKRLQQLHEDAWGQLPERVRKQMQSQMVERFLPSYRRQIEAYFEALMESQ